MMRCLLYLLVGASLNPGLCSDYVLAPVESADLELTDKFRTITSRGNLCII